MFNEYPYCNLTDLNLDWILKEIKELTVNLEDFVKLNTVKYADPIDWNISIQYEANTVVVNEFTGVAYLSTKPVPSGVNVTNTDYWTPIFTLDFVNLNKNITLRNDGNNNNATFASSIGDWLIVGGQLYKVIQDISLHTGYVVGYNIQIYSVELFVRDYLNQVLTMIGDIDDLDTSDKTDIISAINSVLTDINNTIGDLDDLTTSDKSSVVNAINSVLTDINNTIGDLDDLTTSDKSSVVNAINSVLSDINTKIGDLDDLNTSDKTDIVNAINETLEKISSDSDILVSGGKTLYGTIETIFDPTNKNVQGFVHFEGYNYIACPESVGDQTTIYKFNDCNLVDSITGTYYHANSLCIDPDNRLMYSADCLEYTADSYIRYSSISVFDIDTFSFVRRINTNLATEIATNALFIVDGELYNIGLNNKVYKIDVDTGTATLICTLDYDGYTTFQSADADENHIYVCTSAPGGIITYDWTGQRINSLNIGNKITQCFAIEEIEDITITDNDIYICSRTGSTGTIIKGLRFTSTSMIGTGTESISSSIITVDGVTNTSERIKLLQFEKLQHAIYYMMSCPVGEYRFIVSDNTGDLVYNADYAYLSHIDYIGTGYSNNITINGGRMTFYGTIDMTANNDSRFLINCQYGSEFSLALLGTCKGQPSNLNAARLIKHEIGTGVINMTLLSFEDGANNVISDLKFGSTLIKNTSNPKINTDGSVNIIGNLNGDVTGTFRGYTRKNITINANIAPTAVIDLSDYGVTLDIGTNLTLLFDNNISLDFTYMINNQSAVNTIFMYHTTTNKLAVVSSAITNNVLTLTLYEVDSNGNLTYWTGTTHQLINILIH